MEVAEIKKDLKRSWHDYQKELELLRKLDCRPYQNSAYSLHSMPETFMDILTYRVSFLLLTQLLNREGISVQYDPTYTHLLSIEEDMNDDQFSENYDEFMDFYFEEQAPFTYYTKMGFEVTCFDSDLLKSKLLKESPLDGVKEALFQFLAGLGMDTEEMENGTAEYDGLYAYMVKLPGMDLETGTVGLSEDGKALFLKCEECLSQNSAYCGLVHSDSDLYHIVLIGVEDECCWTEADYGAAAFYAVYLLKRLYEQL